MKVTNVMLRVVTVSQFKYNFYAVFFQESKDSVFLEIVMILSKRASIVIVTNLCCSIVGGLTIPRVQQQLNQFTTYMA